MLSATAGSKRRHARQRGLLLCACRLLAALFSLLVVTACAERDRGTEATPRVVSISPNMTETMFALGAGRLQVGRSRHCDHPPEATSLPVVGGFADPSVELILGLRPTLVIGDRGPAGPVLAQRLEAQQIATFFPPVESVADLHAMIAGLGERLGRSAEAQALVARLRDEVAGVTRRIAGRPRVRALLVFDASPIVVAGPGGFPDELLRLAGAVNLVERGGSYPTIGMEHVVALDPDVVIDATVAGTGTETAPDAPAALLSKPGWGELRAARTGRLRALRSSTALRPGPRIAQGLSELVGLLHERGASGDGATQGH